MGSAGATRVNTASMVEEKCAHRCAWKASGERGQNVNTRGYGQGEEVDHQHATLRAQH